LAEHTKMAQTGFTPISLYNTATAAAVPTAGNLVAGELAINTNDGKLFYKDSSGVVQTIASKAGNLNVSSFSGGSTGLTPNIATTGAVTLAGTLAVANGGTGVTTSTGSGANVLGTSPTVTNPALAGATSGSVTLAVPAVAGSNTATLPAATGTVMVTGNMPAFSAYSTAYTSSSVNVWTKITWNTEDYDTNNNFASSTFTPTVAGYYQVNSTIEFVAIGVAGNIMMSLYKNGSRFLDGAKLQIPTGTNFQTTVSGIIYCNGSTDTIEVYGQQSSGTMNIGSNSSTIKFTGCLVRAA